jgi:WASH complex subunit strumpellin
LKRPIELKLKITETQCTTYSLERGGWFLSDDGTEICGLKAVSLLRDSIGVYGLVGIDRLLSYRILHELHRFVKFFKTNVSKHGVLLEQLRDGVSIRFELGAIIFAVLTYLIVWHLTVVPGMEYTR